MASKTWNLREARQALPRLVREAAAGAGPFSIGRRGEPAVVLVGAAEYDALRRRGRPVARSPSWATLRLELTGSAADLDRDLAALGAELGRSLLRLGEGRETRRRRRR